MKLDTQAVTGGPSGTETMGRVTHGYYGADGACPRCKATDCHWGTDGDGRAIATCGACGYRERVQRRTAPPADATLLAPGGLAHLTASVRATHPMRAAPSKRTVLDVVAIVPERWTVLSVVIAQSGRTRYSVHWWVRKWIAEGVVESRRDLLPVSRKDGTVNYAWVTSVRRVPNAPV